MKQNLLYSKKHLYVVKQQTPKPEAQLPDASPPLSVQSSPVLQIPLMVGSMIVVHSLLRKVTTENNENASESNLSNKWLFLRLFISVCPAHELNAFRGGWTIDLSMFHLVEILKNIAINL